MLRLKGVGCVVTLVTVSNVSLLFCCPSTCYLFLNNVHVAYEYPCNELCSVTKICHFAAQKQTGVFLAIFIILATNQLNAQNLLS